MGRRIGLFDIVKARRVLGQSPETIAEQFELAPLLVHEVLAFAEQHGEEVDAYVVDYQATLDSQKASVEPSPVQLRIRRLMAERATRESKAES